MEDAFGRAVYDFLHGEAMEEIIERDDGWIATGGLGGPAHYFAEYEDWPAHEREAIALARGKVLDVGCGAGRVGLYLEKKGFEVVGIDTSPLTVRTAGERGVKCARLASVTEYKAAPGTFGTIVMYGNNFGLVANEKRAHWLLKRFRRMTSPDGKVLACTLDPYDTSVPEHLAYHRRNRKRGRMGGQVTIRVRYRRSATPWWDLLFVSRDEMKDIVRGTGWKVERFCESGGAAYVAVLEKA